MCRTNSGENVEQQELSFMASGNVKWNSHYGKVSLLHIKLNVHLLTTKQSVSWICQQL